MIDQTGCGLWLKLDRTTTWPILQVQFTLKKKLSYHDQSDQVQPMTITRQNNNETEHTHVVYAENNIELSWTIGLGAICD